MELFYSISVTYNKESILTMQSLCSFDLEGEKLFLNVVAS